MFYLRVVFSLPVSAIVSRVPFEERVCAMQRWAILIIGIGAILVVAASLTARILFPPATPALPLLTPIPTSTPTVFPSPVSDDLPQFASSVVDVRQAVQLTLGSEWRHETVSAADAAQSLRQIGADNSRPNQRASQILSNALTDDATILAASHAEAGPNDFATSLVVMAFMRDGLSLERYLEDVEAELRSQGAAILEKSITSDYRLDHLPVALLHYTLPVQAPAAKPSTGLQLVTYDQTSERLIVFTFETSPANDANLIPLALKIVRAATF
jgi:hypothetical protein